MTRGPGATNASIGVHTAFQDSTPMILFIGQVGSDFVEREAFQEIDYRRMFGPMAKWVAQIDRADRIPEYVAPRLPRRDVGPARARSCSRCPRTCCSRRRDVRRCAAASQRCEPHRRRATCEQLRDAARDGASGRS